METKKRNRFVTVWLIIMIFFNGYIGIKYLLFSDAVIAQDNLDISKGIVLLEGLLSLMMAFFALMIYEWKKWGFWGILGVSLLTLIINISMGMGTILSAAVSIGSIAILYLILQIKKDNVSVWENLE